MTRVFLALLVTLLVQSPFAAQFNVGSLNKAFTGAAIMLLAEEGKVDLDAHCSETRAGSVPTW